MLTRLGPLLLALSFLGRPAVAADCGAVDFLALPLPTTVADPAAASLAAAYRDVTVEGEIVVLPDGTRLPLGADPGRAPRDRLDEPTIREQFHDPYPLAFDLESRRRSWFDPGRARSEGFFQALYGSSAAAVKRQLEKATIGGATFYMTGAQGVACQMAAALAAVAGLAIDWRPFFRDVGGSFNWRPIAGTRRYSAHSYGIAFDLNTALGGYWRWSGRPEGDAGAYDNRIPREIVEAFERYGFIWGGKWHHFDGMHFEYRPELILHARLTGR